MSEARKLFLSRALPSAILLSLLALAGCDRRPDTFAPADLRGVWAWYGAENCWNHGNTISFEPEATGTGSRVVVRLHGEQMLDVGGASLVRQAGEDGSPLMIVRYTLQGRSFEEQYRVADMDRIVVFQSLVDGKPQASLPMLKDKALVRCEPGDLMPPGGTAANLPGAAEGVDLGPTPAQSPANSAPAAPAPAAPPTQP